MANQKQLAILKKGVKAWNKWREENPKAKINLSRAKLDECNLSLVEVVDANGSEYKPSVSVVNLANANLSGARFKQANLLGADLRGANLSKADMSLASLVVADLRGADLFGASLVGADLRDASLARANLAYAILYAANLDSTSVDATEFKYSTFGRTVIAGIDLRNSRGLRKIAHEAPSHLAIDTIRLSLGKIPDVFLRGCGLSDFEIEETKLANPHLSNDEVTKILYRMYDLRASQALQFSPLFISYSHADGAFVDKLERQLTERGIRFWRDIHDMKAGGMEKQIDMAIQQNPTMLLVLSRHSLNSDWVEHEVRRAREVEKEIGRDVLCPVALDNSWKSSTWPQRIIEQVTEYNILDFSAWKDDSKFDIMFRKLVAGLELFYKK